MTEEGFCPNCGITLDLHDDGDDDVECQLAERRADLLDRFQRFIR